MTKLEENERKALAYLDEIVGARYSWWTGGKVPDGAPAWAKNGPPPPPADVRGTSCFCAGVTNLARRAVGLEIPHLGNRDYDGGVVAYLGSTAAAPRGFPRQGYFEKHGRQREFDLKEARRPWTLIGRKYRNVEDQGHVAIVLPNGKVLQSYDTGGGRPGVNKDVTLERSHSGGYYEVMVHAEDWLLPLDYDRRKPERPEPERPEPERPEPERPEPKRPEPKRPEPERPEPAVTLFTARQLLEIAENPHLGLATVEKYRNALIPEMRKAGITTPLRMAALFGNVVVETDRLNTLEEYGDEAYFRYGPPEGDGIYLGSEWRYHGRGFLMNTWRDAYARLSRVLGEDLLANPDLLARPDLAAKAAMWFWTQHDLNAYADRDNFRAVAAIINTGQPNKVPNHWLERLRFYDRAKRVLSGGPSVTRGDGFNRDGLPYINLAAVGQADETAAFALAEGIRRAGIGVTVINGVDNVYAFAEEIRPEPLGYRQLWIMGQPALDACGDYGDLANWPASPETDYYNLAGRSLTGTCRRAAELADEKAKGGVGRRFLEEMGMANHAPARPPLPAPAPPQGEEDRGLQEEEEYRRPREERAEKDQDSLETPTDIQEQEGEEYLRRREERAEESPPEVTTGAQGSNASLGALVDRVRNNKALLTWLAGVAVTWLVGRGYLAEGETETMTTNLVAGFLFVLGLLARQMAYGPVTVEKEYRKKDDK